MSPTRIERVPDKSVKEIIFVEIPDGVSGLFQIPHSRFEKDGSTWVHAKAYHSGIGHFVSAPTSSISRPEDDIDNAIMKQFVGGAQKYPVTIFAEDHTFFIKARHVDVPRGLKPLNPDAIHLLKRKRGKYF